jgi:hypothetical protein
LIVFASLIDLLMAADAFAIGSRFFGHRTSRTPSRFSALRIVRGRHAASCRASHFARFVSMRARRLAA